MSAAPVAPFFIRRRRPATLLRIPREQAPQFSQDDHR